MTAPGILDGPWYAAADGDADSHIYCCDPGRSLCGETLEGEDLGRLCDGPVDCMRCEVINAAHRPCGAPFCNLRCWWRRWRS